MFRIVEKMYVFSSSQRKDVQKFPLQWCHIGSLKLAIRGVFTSQAILQTSRPPAPPNTPLRIRCSVFTGIPLALVAIFLQFSKFVFTSFPIYTPINNTEFMLFYILTNIYDLDFSFSHPGGYVVECQFEFNDTWKSFELFKLACYLDLWT